MSRKDSGSSWLPILVIGLVLLFFMKGGSTTNYANYSFSLDGLGGIPSNPSTVTNSNSVLLSINPNIICLGESVTASIDSDIPNGVCAIFTDTGTGWKWMANVNLNANGDYAYTSTVNAIGTANVRVVCQSNQNTYVVSNTVTLVVRDCGTGTTTTMPSTTTTLSSSENCEIFCQTIGYDSGFAFWIPDYCYGDILQYNSDIECCCMIDVSCTDTDGGNDIFHAGTCSDISGSYADYCYYTGISLVLKEYNCVDNICQESTVSCPYMQDACSEGACWILD